MAGCAVVFLLRNMTTQLLPTTIAAVLLMGCAVEEPSPESPPAKAEVESQATNAPVVTVEPSAVEAVELPPPRYQGPAPTVSIHEAAAQGRI